VCCVFFFFFNADVYYMYRSHAWFLSYVLYFSLETQVIEFFDHFLRVGSHFNRLCRLFAASFKVRESKGEIDPLDFGDYEGPVSWWGSLITYVC
jgi:hypothetical protein